MQLSLRHRRAGAKTHLPPLRRWSRMNGMAGVAVRAIWLATTLCLASLTLACEHSIQAAPSASASKSPTTDARSTSTQTRGTGSTASNLEAGQARQTLRLASWNLRWLSATDLRGPVPRTALDYARLGRYAKQLNADIVAVQEVESVKALARVFDPERYNFHVAADRRNQNTGFVYAKQLNVTIFPDHAALSVGGLRSGADIAVHFEKFTLRLLSVHLHSGCFDAPLGKNAACVALGAQIPKLEAWMDDRAKESTPFAVLGDFNRRFFGRPNEEVWGELDDASPAESNLESPTRNIRSTCWSAEHPQFIDHLVLSQSLTARVVAHSFTQQTYDVDDLPHRKQLSDHCPIAVSLHLVEASDSPRIVANADSAALPKAQSPGALPLIKGNISRRGKRLYHTVDCPNYERVKIDPAKGERYFSSEQEAQEAGFERARACRK